MNGTCDMNVIQLYRGFFDFWRGILGSVANGTVCVASMEILFENKGKKFDNISEIYYRYSKLAEPQSVKNMQNKFCEYKNYYQLLQSFNQHFMFSECKDKNLQSVVNVVTELEEKWSDGNFKVSDLFGIDLKRFDGIRDSLEILWHYKESKIAIHLWTDIVESIKKKWSMQQLKEKNTFELSVWLRNEYRKEFIFDERKDFGCEVIIHWIFDAEIDGLKLGLLLLSLCVHLSIFLFSFV